MKFFARGSFLLTSFGTTFIYVLKNIFLLHSLHSRKSLMALVKKVFLILTNLINVENLTSFKMCGSFKSLDSAGLNYFMMNFLIDC